jgi:carbon-monoxide dehydrogenase medium subunit
MVISDIALHLPKNLSEAVRLLGELEEALVLAGGTDLLVDIKQDLVKVKNLISLKKIKELKGIEKKDNRIRIGALSTPGEVMSDPLINRYIPALADAAASMASFQIRSMATVGGNISSAVPSADLPPTLIAAEATVELHCSDSSREVSLSEFFTGPREMVCGKRELLTSVFIPLPPDDTGIAFQKFALREASALAVVNVASRLTIKNEKIARALIVLGAVAPTPVLASKASGLLCGNKPSGSLFEKAALTAREEGKPISDIRGSIWHRKELIQVLTRRTLDEALSQVQGKLRRGK